MKKIKVWSVWRGSYSSSLFEGTMCCPITLEMGGFSDGLHLKAEWKASEKGGGDHTFLPHFRKTLSSLSVLMLSTTNSCMTNKEKSVQFQQSFYLCTAGQSQGEAGVNVVSQLVGSVKATSLICDKDVWSYYIYFILFSLTLHC